MYTHYFLHAQVMLDSSDAMHIVKMDLANLIMKAPPEKREVRVHGKNLYQVQYQSIRGWTVVLPPSPDFMVY